MNRFFAVAAALFASGALLAGCATSGAVRRPDVALPGQFSQSGAQALPDRWWLAFDDPALSALIDQALAGNLDIRIAWARLDQAAAVTRGADASAMPQVNASGSGGLSSRIGGTGGSSLGPSVTAGLAASYELDLWGQIRASRDAARFDEQATAADLQSAAITLTGEIALSWYQLVQARAEDALLANQIQQSQQTLDLVTRRVTAGLAPLDDQLRQQQAVESLNGDRALAAAQISTLEHKLAVLIGRAPTDAVAPAGATLATLPPLPATGVPSQLLERRPDVIAAYLRVESADRGVAAAVAARYPQVSIKASTSISVPFTGWAVSLIANLLQPIYDGGKLAAEVDRSRAALEEAVLSYQSTVLNAASEVEDALVTEQRQVENLASLDRQLALSQQTLDAEEKRYTAGLEDYLSVLSAQQSLEGLQRQRLGAQGTLLSNRISLYRALAGDWGLTRPARA